MMKLVVWNDVSLASLGIISRTQNTTAVICHCLIDGLYIEFKDLLVVEQELSLHPQRRFFQFSSEYSSHCMRVGNKGGRTSVSRNLPEEVCQNFFSVLSFLCKKNYTNCIL